MCCLPKSRQQFSSRADLVHPEAFTSAGRPGQGPRSSSAGPVRQRRGHLAGSGPSSRKSRPWTLPLRSGTGEVGITDRDDVRPLRLALGFIFFWAFLDKLFGLGHSTASAKSWLNGGSPTAGFLGNAATGPFTSFYHSLAGTTFADVLFMAALLGIGAALLLGIAMRIATVLIVLALLGAGNTLGLGRLWTATGLVRRAPWLA